MMKLAESRLWLSHCNGISRVSPSGQKSESFGIVIFQAESGEAAQALMCSDPAVKSDVMHAELFPYRIALMSKP